MTNIKKLIKGNYQQVLFVFLAFLTMVLVSDFYVSGIVREQMLAIGEETMNTTQTAVSAYLSETELAFANVAQTAENMLTNHSTNEEMLTFLQHTNEYFDSSLPDFMKVYGSLRGEFLVGSDWRPESDYEPQSRPWYIGAEESNGKIFCSEPYIDVETNDMCISFSQKVFDDSGNAHGVLAIDIKLARITDYIDSQQVANNGYGVLLSDTMNFTAHRDKRLLGVNISQAGGEYDLLAQMLKEGKPIAAVRFTDADGTDSIAFFRTIFNGWHIGVVIPRASYYKQVNILVLVLGILGFMLMAALSSILVRTRNEKLRSDEESRSKSSFLARMSHEMRTPMNAIIGMNGIARRSSDLAKIQACLVKIDDASNHLLGVINDVLDMSKIEAGKLELSETDFVFERALRQVDAIMSCKIAEKKQYFTIQVEEDVPTAVITDQQRLAQVLANLLSNANKFTPEGGHIQLHVQRLEDVNGYCVLQIEIADDGIGISKDQQSRLFHTFEQGDGSVSRRYGGTGLGLAICQKIINLMGGTIWIESEPGEGSRFIFTVRVGIGTAENTQPSPENEEHLEAQGSLPMFAGKHILLAEDVEINREIVIALLCDTGVDIECAENGQQACDKVALNKGAYDLIFMDIHMPEVDGFEAAKCIRAMNFPRAKTIPIVAMTANVFREDIDNCLAAGMNDHIGKPLNTDELIAKTKLYLLPRDDT